MKLSIRSILKKASMLFALSRDPLFSCSAEKQREYLIKLPEPQDLVERSWLQYRCQMMLYGFVPKVVLNVLSIPLVLILFCRTGAGVHVSYNWNSSNLCKNKNPRAVFMREGKDREVLPKSLSTEFNVIDDENLSGSILLKEDKKFLLQILRRYPLSWHFVLKIQLKIALYRYVVEEYSPSALICCSEYSFASSAVTQWCRFNCLQHINVMHGEKLFYIRDSFFCFDRCYIWANKYKELFRVLRAEQSQFVVEVPSALKIEKSDIAPTKDFTYYLGGESGDKLYRIKRTLDKLVENGYVVAVRPHPRYSNKEEIENIFSGLFIIEDPEKTPIKRSIQSTCIAVSLYSTCLLQAYLNGISACIDDLSDPDWYEELLKRKYVLAELSSLRLSSLV